MALLEYNEITKKKYIVFEGEPYEILDSHVFRKQQRKPVNQVKMKHLIGGRVVEHSFHQSEKVEEAEIDSKPIKFLYKAKGEYWFNDKDDPSKRFSFNESLIGDQGNYIKANAILDLLTFEDKVVGFKMPIKVDLKVVEAPPAVKGDTAQGAMKQAKLETGVMINVPLFINEGDMIRVNSDSGEYVERADKS
jgi:elongation factor P